MHKARLVIGSRIRRLREKKGYSCHEVARELGVDKTAVASWEMGKYLPRSKNRIQLAQMLGSSVPALFTEDADGQTAEITASVVDTMTELSEVLVALTRQARHKLCALRLAAPYSTPAFVQTEWRKLVEERLLGGTLEVHRIEIFYDLRRLQETLSNILRYDGHAYHVKSYCAGLTEVAPAMGGYFFDDDEFLLGAYWTGVPPHQRPGLRMSGGPFRIFFSEYWDEIWRRGTLLNIRGAHDLSEVKALALKLGLAPADWKSFVEEAREIDMGDGAPPLV